MLKSWFLSLMIENVSVYCKPSEQNYNKVEKNLYLQTSWKNIPQIKKTEENWKLCKEGAFDAVGDKLFKIYFAISTF